MLWNYAIGAYHPDELNGPFNFGKWLKLDSATMWRGNGVLEMQGVDKRRNSCKVTKFLGPFLSLTGGRLFVACQRDFATCLPTRC
jgi:hypothetical protein